ncbi:MAG: hypothetical protein WBW69_15415 [Candidatus Korobacteraceae bacterium]
MTRLVIRLDLDGGESVLSQVSQGARPGAPGWSKEEKRGLADIIRAKMGASELQYLRLMQRHEKLKQVMVRLGSRLPQ